MVTGAHTLLGVLHDAAEGRFPPRDGAAHVLPPDRDGTWAVVSFTAHALVLGDVDVDELRLRGADGIGGATSPGVLSWLAGDAGHIGSFDVVLARRGEVGPVLPRSDAFDDHPRVLRARAHRRDVEVLANDTGIAIIGTGLAARTELSVELLDTTAVGTGAGRRLIRAGLAALAPDRWCFAQVAPGNVASLRAFLSCGFVPIGSEVLIGRG